MQRLDGPTDAFDTAKKAFCLGDWAQIQLISYRCRLDYCNSVLPGAAEPCR